MLHEMLLFLRNKKGISQNLAAEGLKVSRDAYVRYENGSRTPNADFLRNVCLYYGISADYLLEVTTNPHRLWDLESESCTPETSGIADRINEGGAAPGDLITRKTVHNQADLIHNTPLHFDDIPAPDTLAAHDTAGAFPVSKERMEEIVIEAYHLIMAQRAYDAANAAIINEE